MCNKKHPPHAHTGGAGRPKPKLLAGEAYEAHLRAFLRQRLQPRGRDYDGMGLAKASVWLDLREPEFLARFEDVFLEHVAGWSGYKPYKKRKTEKEKGMAWRRLLSERASGPTAGSRPGETAKERDAAIAARFGFKP